MASFIDTWRESKVRKIAVVTWFALWCLFLECAVAGLIIYATIQASADDTSLFCWHPYLFAGGFCIVLSQSTYLPSPLKTFLTLSALGVLVYVCFPWLPRDMNRVLHGLLGLTWLGFAIAGLVVVVYFKEEHNYANFME